MNDDEAKAAVEQYFAGLHHMSMLLMKMAWRVRKKPLLGASFTLGRYFLCSVATVERGLDMVTYYVMEESGFVLSCSESKDRAVSSARHFLKSDIAGRFPSEFAAHRAAIEAYQAERRAAWEEQVEERRKQADSETKVRSIPRRRREIFEKSGGKCHYCGEVLTLDGSWHVEHKMPRALGGDNAPGNLVASCTKCNHEKRDRTDQEYLAKRAARGGKQEGTAA